MRTFLCQRLTATTKDLRSNQHRPSCRFRGRSPIKQDLPQFSHTLKKMWKHLQQIQINHFLAEKGSWMRGRSENRALVFCSMVGTSPAHRAEGGDTQRESHFVGPLGLTILEDAYQVSCCAAGVAVIPFPRICTPLPRFVGRRFHRLDSS